MLSGREGRGFGEVFNNPAQGFLVTSALILNPLQIGCKDRMQVPWGRPDNGPSRDLRAAVAPQVKISGVRMTLTPVRLS